MNFPYLQNLTDLAMEFENAIIKCGQDLGKMLTATL